MSWPLHSLALVLLLFGADTPTVRLEEQPDRLRVLLEWPMPVTSTPTVKDRELLLRFDRALEFSAEPDLAARVPSWIEGVSLGYDTLLLRAARDVQFIVTSSGSTVSIELRPIERPDTVPAADQREGERRLQLLRAQLMVAEGRLAPAAAALQRLLEVDPGSVPALLTLAQVEQRRGRWRVADTLLRRALPLDPLNDDTVLLRAEVLGPHASRLRGDVEVKDVEGAQREQIGRMSGHALLGGAVRIGGIVERNEMTLAGALHQRDRGELYGQVDLERGTALRVAGFATRRGIGAGIGLTHPDASGRTTVQADLRRPFWEIVEGITGYGTRDRAEIRREQPLGARLSVRAGAAANRYGLDGIGTTARTLALDGGAVLALRGANPIVNIEYATDIEWLRTLRPGTLPLTSREVHAASVTTQVRLTRTVVADGFIGYAVDRLGGRGPFNGARLTHGGPSRLGAEIWIERRLNALTTTQRVTRAGAHLSWRLTQ